MPAGRPLVWDDPKALEEAVERYFRTIDHPTWTGLALHLGFESRQSLNNYLDKPEFFYPLKKALTRIEQQYEMGLYGRNPAGAIFALKNFGWKDKQEIDQNTKHSGGIKIEWSDPTDSQD